MRYTEIKGERLSFLSLGTVQLGLDYGISNASGKPDLSTAFSILNKAKERGINVLDTASAYGDSEEIIGKWMKDVPQNERPFVVTKSHSLDHSSLSALRNSMRSAAKTSMERLGLEQLPLLMLHHCDEFFSDEENVKTVFRELKEEGLIRFCGVSAYAHHDYGRIADAGFDAVQIPLNLFDWRQIDSGGVDALADSGMIVFVRSVYLQGLVFRDPASLDPKMEFCRDTLIKFRDLCEKYSLSPAELALSFAAGVKGVSGLVLGSERPEQVEQNADLFEKLPVLSEAQMNEIHEAFSDTDFRVITPTEWNK